MTNKNNFYITTPIFYASGAPHLGHAYTSIAADVLARWNRNIGKEVFFQTGTDEHGAKIVKTAAKINKKPEEFIEFIVPQFKNLLSKLNISYDYFIRTTNEEHKKFIQKMLQKSFDNGDIYKGTYKGLYCTDCERYYIKEDLIDEKICPDHKKEVENIEEENYFFKLSKYENKLLEYYNKNKEFLSPHSKAQEIINRVKNGLQDISISRNKNKLKWGIELPFDKEHVTYVWFDALFNYLSGCEINNKNEFWPANVHLIGKDIMWFHQVYWPAFLMSVKSELPKKVFAHGFILNNNHKMSKSLGNVINPIKYSKKYGVDEFRFAILSLGSFGDDINFTDELFINKINNELNNDFGNLVSRVHAMTEKYFNKIIPQVKNPSKEDLDFIKKLNIYDNFNLEIQNFEFSKALNILFTAIRETNAYVNQVQPWKEKDKEKLGTIINIIISASTYFGKYLEAFMPEKIELLFKQFNLENNKQFEFEFVKSGIKLNEKENLFKKIKLEKETKSNKQIEELKEGFTKLNLKVGQIYDIKKHQDSDKLYIIQVNLGDEKRQIVSGLQQLYSLKELENKKIIVISNLKVAKLAGTESNGMILACEDKNENVGLLTTDLEIGTNLKCGDDIANNEKIINSKQFKKIEMFGVENGVEYNKIKIKGIKVDKNLIGKVC